MLGVDGLRAPMVLDVAMNGAAFLAYVEQVLTPELRTGDVVVMDNLSSHHVKGVREAIEGAGAECLYLPPHSPDFNPIEQAFRSSKGCCVRQQRARWRVCGKLLPRPWRPLVLRNVPTASETQDMGQIEWKML